MRSLNKRAAVLAGCLTLALVFLTPQLIHGDDWNLATRFSVNQPFEVPGMVLQPNTPYVIKLYDSPSERNVVQIWNSDQTRMLTMFIAISDERLETTDNTLFTFIETQPGFPLPIKEWFYPGRLIGREFVYPKQQALEIARHARESILSADSTDIHRLSRITVEAKEGVSTETSTTATASNVTKSESTAVLEKPSVEETKAPEETPNVDQEQQAEQKNEDDVQQIAQNENPEVQQPEVQEPAPAPVTEQNRELPRTAGELPLIALIGVLCVGGGLGLKVISTKS